MGFFDTPDHSAEFSDADRSSNKVLAIVAYLGPLWLIPFFVNLGSKSPYLRFHLNQSLLLLIIGIVTSVVFGVLSIIPLFGLIFGILGTLAGLVFFVFMILGIVYAAQDKAKELPLLGGVHLL